jgi:hypothetical protein
LGGNIVSGVNTLNPIVNATGTYTLRVTNNYNGCTAISNASVTAQLAPPVITTTGGTFTCTQPNITLQVATNAPNPGFLWSGPNNFSSTLQNPVVNQPGTYTVLVTNGNTGCTATATAVVNAGNDTPDVSATGGDITCIQNAVTLAATSGVAGVTYAWTGPNNFNSTLQNPTVSATGNYQVVVTAPNGCTNTAVAAVVLNTTPPGTTLAASGSLNCNNDAVNVLATSNGNPALLTHAWTLPGGATQNTGAVAFLPATVAGVYSVLVNNTATGCTSTASFTVVEFDDVTASIGTTTDTKCAGSADGSLQAVPAGGNGVYTYNWSNGGNTAINTGLIAGAYVVTVTDGEGCSTTASGTVGSPAALVATGSATAQTANGTTDGTATVDQTGGTPGYTYLWSNAATTQNISGLLPGSYTVTVTDANGCTAIATVNVNQYNCLLQTSLQVINVSCFGANDGAALLSFEGGTSPFDVTWSTGVGTNDVSDLAPGQYSVSVVDAANCPQVQTFTITEPVVLAVNGAGSITTGVGSNDGTATANPTGGTGAYSYAWSNSETTAAISNLAPGLYTVTVTDENSCSAIQTIEVVVGNCNLSTDLQITQPTCSNSADGAVTLILTGGAGGFSYNWSSGSTTETESGLAAGSQVVTVTDVNGCSIQVPVTLVAPDALIITVDSTFSTDCPANPEGAAYISVAGGTGDLSVTWSNNQSGLSLTGLTAGTYTATLTDDNGCTTTQAVVIGSNDTEAPAITALPVEVPIGTNGTVVLTEQNVQADITDNCGVTSVVFQPASFECTQLGEHQVTIVATDGSGLTATATVTVTIVDDEAPALICSPSLVLCFEDNPVSYQAPTATDNCLINGIVFNITGGLPIGATFPVGTTLTTYSAVDAQGNEGTCSFEVTILSPLTLEIDTIINDFNFQTVGAIFVNVSGSLAPYNYSWVSEGVEISTSQNLTGVPAGDYLLQITDDNGCNITSQILTISNTSDTKTPALLDGIRVFPNPTPGNLSVLLPDALVASDVYLQVFDQTGRRVLDQHASNDKVIDVAMFNLADGLYSLVIRAGEQQVVHKIVLTK